MFGIKFLVQCILDITFRYNIVSLGKDGASQSCSFNSDPYVQEPTPRLLQHQVTPLHSQLNLTCNLTEIGRVSEHR